MTLLAFLLPSEGLVLSIKSLVALIAYIALCLVCLRTQHYVAIAILTAVTGLVVGICIGFPDRKRQSRVFAVIALALFLLDANSEVSPSKMAGSIFASTVLEGGSNSTDRLPCRFYLGSYSFYAYMPGREARNALVFRCLGSVVVAFFSVMFWRETCHRDQGDPGEENLPGTTR